MCFNPFLHHVFRWSLDAVSEFFHCPVKSADIRDIEGRDQFVPDCEFYQHKTVLRMFGERCGRRLERWLITRQPDEERTRDYDYMPVAHGLVGRLRGIRAVWIAEPVSERVVRD
jgi:hypothetical protein